MSTNQAIPPQPQMPTQPSSNNMQTNPTQQAQAQQTQLTPDQISYLRAQHPHIAIPCYAGQVFETVMVSMLKFVLFCQKIGMNFSLDTMVNESLISRGRCHLVSKMMENSVATHLMWIDSDIGFEPEHIIQLLLHDKDVVGGLYPKKTLPIDYVVNVLPDAVNKENGQIKTVGSLIPVSRMGTGFMLVKRRVFEKMFEAYPQTKFKGNIGLDPKFDKWLYALYDSTIASDTNEYLSEDWTFCSLWRQIGGEIWADSSIRLSHSGFFKYPGNPDELNKMMGTNLQAKIAVRQDEHQNNGLPEHLKPKVYPKL